MITNRVCPYRSQPSDVYINMLYVPRLMHRRYACDKNWCRFNQAHFRKLDYVECRIEIKDRIQLFSCELWKLYLWYLAEKFPTTISMSRITSFLYAKKHGWQSFLIHRFVRCKPIRQGQLIQRLHRYARLFVNIFHFQAA